jgi:hypothetical protein
MTSGEINEQIDRFESWAQILVKNGVLDIPFNFGEVSYAMLSQYIRKNSDYGNSFHETHKTFGATAGFVRINDKINRIDSLRKGAQKVVSESLADTLMDAATYCVMQAAELSVVAPGKIQPSSEAIAKYQLNSMSLHDAHATPPAYRDMQEARAELHAAYDASAKEERYKQHDELHPSSLMVAMARRFVATLIEEWERK